MMDKWNYYFVKRCLDCSISLLLMAGVLSWLMPLLALLIKMDSTGAVIFSQKRIGKGGRVFTCYKLRTMMVNPQADNLPALEDDPRITRIGKFLRRTHLDELPQLINVLFGAMSLVGPRPYMAADEQRYATLVQYPTYRYAVKPGITGLAQVRGLHGALPDAETIFERYQCDAFYVRHACFLLDWRILRLTFLQFFTKKTFYEGGVHSEGYAARC